MPDVNGRISHAGHKERTVKVCTRSGLSSADRCVSVAGTWGGATVVIEGSNDGASWFTLNRQGSPLSFTAVGLAQVEEIPLYTRSS